MFNFGLNIDPVTELIRGLKADGVWDKTQLISVVRGSQSASLVNLKNAAEIGANVGNASFTPYRGFTCASTSAYIDTGKIPVVTNSSGHLWCYIRSNTTPVLSARKYCGCTTSGATDAALALSFSTFPAPDITDNNIYYPGTAAANIDADLPTGFIGATRNAANFTETRINSTTASNAGTPASPTVALAHSFYVGAYNVYGTAAGGVPGEYAGWGFGEALSAAELGYLRTRVQTYMEAIGAQA